MSEIALSPTSIGLFKDCPRCFYLEKVLEIKRPEGKFPSLDRGMGRILKPWYDSYRLHHELPPEIKNQIEGLLLPDQTKLNRWRNWKGGLSCYIGNVKVIGAIDDVLVDDVGLYSPFYYKAKGSALKNNETDAYQHQLDCCSLLLQKNDMPINGKGYISYYWPVEAADSDSKKIIFTFNCEVKRLEVSPDSTIELVQKIEKCMTALTAPEASDACEYCSYLSFGNVTTQRKIA